MAQQDIYQIVTNRMIQALEENRAPWIKPWSDKGGSTELPFNHVTKKYYNGINILLLWDAAERNNFVSNQWLTFNQAKTKKAKVKKGSKGTQIIFWKILEKEEYNQKTNETETKKIPMARFYTVFNADQVEGLKLEEKSNEEHIKEWEDMDAVEADIASLNANIQHGGNRAYYRPKDDFIQIPEKEQFGDGGAYYATLLHEFVHWTGNDSRLERKTGRSFGDEDYAKEELVAEIGSAFLCAEYNIEGMLQHENYIKSWIKVLKNDKRAIVSAASKAQKAVEFLHQSMQNKESKAA